MTASQSDHGSVRVKVFLRLGSIVSDREGEEGAIRMSFTSPAPRGLRAASLSVTRSPHDLIPTQPWGVGRMVSGQGFKTEKKLRSLH